MDIIKIKASDGDVALFVNAVLVSYYDSVIDDALTLTALNTTTDNLCKALGGTVHTYRFEKNADFVHWESSEQVKALLWPEHVKEAPSAQGTFNRYDDALIGTIINFGIKSCKRNEVKSDFDLEQR